MKLNLVLKVETPSKPTIESSINEKMFYENAKEFLDTISKKCTKFSKSEKNELYHNHWVNVCFESNIINMSSDTWWLDNDAIIHACNSM